MGMLINQNMDSRQRDLIEYLQNKLFSRYSGRYHFTQNKKADIIIVSRDGFAYSHLNVEDMEDPTPQDKEGYPRVTRVYIIRSSKEKTGSKLNYTL